MVFDVSRSTHVSSGIRPTNKEQLHSDNKTTHHTQSLCSVHTQPRSHQSPRTRRPLESSYASKSACFGLSFAIMLEVLRGNHNTRHLRRSPHLTAWPAKSLSRGRSAVPFSTVGLPRPAGGNFRRAQVAFALFASTASATPFLFIERSGNQLEEHPETWTRVEVERLSRRAARAREPLWGVSRETRAPVP